MKGYPPSALLLRLLVLVSVLSLSVCIGTIQGIPWTPDYEGALREAQQTRKPVLTYLYIDSCTYCKKMEATTFRDSLVLEDMRDGYLWVKLNAETDPTGVQLRERFQISDYPTIFVMDHDGFEIDRLTGYVDAQNFKAQVEGYLTSPNSFKKLQETVEGDPYSSTANFELAHKYLTRNSLLEAAKHFVNVIVYDPENKSDLTDTSYYWLAFTLATGSQPEEALKQLTNLSTKFPNSAARADGYILESQIHTFADRLNPARSALQAFLAEFPENEKRPWVELMLRELDPASTPMARSH
jgi:thioredoxin-related protein